LEPTPSGDSIALVVRLQAAADGGWYLHVDGTNTLEAIPLAPATLIMHLWRASDTRVLRGTIQLCGTKHVAAIQGNAQLIELMRAWLLDHEDTERQ